MLLSLTSLGTGISTENVDGSGSAVWPSDTVAQINLADRISKVGLTDEDGVNSIPMLRYCNGLADQIWMSVGQCDLARPHAGLESSTQQASTDIQKRGAMMYFGKGVALAVVWSLALLTQAVIAKEIHSEAKKVGGAVNLETITLKGDTLFKFGDDKLSNAGKAALDDLLKKGKLFPTARYLITGHTDRIGDKWDNGKLSIRRAESVRQHLLAKDKNLQLDISGVGDRQPVVECPDKLGKDALAKCLSPNRRVTIEPNSN